ncbi:FAD-binding protein [Thermodesulfobacteriota bacterium]
MLNQIKWKEEADVVIVGFGGAGAVAAIAAHDAGAKVLIIEKQPCDTPSRTRHTPSTRLSGGNWLCFTDPDKMISYHEALVRISNETLDAERKELISIFAQYIASNTDWMRSIGLEAGGDESMGKNFASLLSENDKISDGRLFVSDFPDLPGSDSSYIHWSKVIGKYRGGASFFKSLSDAVRNRDIQVMWETSARHLITQGGEVRGLTATTRGREMGIMAKRATVLTCGGFEFNEWMKENYLRVNPTYFIGNPANTGDGINMVMEAGAALWHMNAASWRVVMKFHDFPIAFTTQRHEMAGIFVDKKGRRFTNERYNLHAFGYELTNYDAHAMIYPKVPCYWIFDEKRRDLGPLASGHGPCNPPGGIMGDIFYHWSEDNQKEIDRGWIMSANTLDDLANMIRKDPNNEGFLSPAVLENTVRQYNDYCLQGEDMDFHKPEKWLAPLEDPPYYAVKLWPGGPNTLGGPKRNTRSQVLRVDNNPIPRLYAAGELGSIYGMIYQGGGNLSECVAFGRLAGINAAAEKVWK